MSGRIQPVVRTGPEKILVPKGGLEPPHPCEYMDLNHARLPIPPLRHARERHSNMLDTSTVFIECYKRWLYCQFDG